MQYYRSEYDHYQEENSVDEKVLRFGEDQGVSDLPAFDGRKTTGSSDTTIQFRRKENPANDYYPTPTFDASQSNEDDSQPRNDSYLEPTPQTRTIAGKASSEVVPLIPPKSDDSSSGGVSKGRAPLRPAPPPPIPTRRDNSGDSYV